jgi:hypothetical protein
MAFLEGKTKSERNKIIAAGVLGLFALVALYLAFGRSFFGGSTTSATVKVTTTPKANSTPAPGSANFPSVEEQQFNYQTVPVVYSPGSAYAPDPGRNIFAFYEPPKPCTQDCPPSPIPSPTPMKSPTPLPPPPMLIAAIQPQSMYAGERNFRLEVSGDKFTPESRIYFNQAEIPTFFINSQKLAGDVSSKFILDEGSKGVIVQTPDGKLYSNQVSLSVQAPPKPTMLYIGMIGRKRYNNDTAYFADNEKAPPYGARLNDVLAGRFRLIDIGPSEVVFEDVTLGFKHRVAISKGILVGSMPPGRGTQPDPGIPTYPPGFVPQQNIPGIPNNVQQYNPEEQRKLMEQKAQPAKEDVDDDGDG